MRSDPHPGKHFCNHNRLQSSEHLRYPHTRSHHSGNSGRDHRRRADGSSNQHSQIHYDCRWGYSWLLPSGCNQDDAVSLKPAHPDRSMTYNQNADKTGWKQQPVRRLRASVFYIPAVRRLPYKKCARNWNSPACHSFHCFFQTRTYKGWPYAPGYKPGLLDTAPGNRLHCSYHPSIRQVPRDCQLTWSADHNKFWGQFPRWRRDSHWSHDCS